MDESIKIFQVANGWLVELPYHQPDVGPNFPDFSNQAFLKTMVKTVKELNRDPLLGSSEDAEAEPTPKKELVPSQLPRADERFFLFLDYKEMIEFLENLR